MARSHKHTPICGMTNARSCKKYKIQEHRKERAKRTCKLRPHLAEIFWDSLAYEDPRIGNEWSSPRDGKQYLDANPQWSYGPGTYFLNWEEIYNKCMRK